MIKRCPTCGTTSERSFDVIDVDPDEAACITLRTHRCPNPDCARVILTEESVRDPDFPTVKVRYPAPAK